MTVGEQRPLAEVKNRLSEVVERLKREHGRVVITKHSHAAARDQVPGSAPGATM
jgi:antitoxin YefM